MEHKSNKELWLQRVADFKSSGQTQVAWCQEQQINVSALRYWIRQLKDDELSNGSTKCVLCFPMLYQLLNRA